jgi:tetratricopeptide (TPR) repeat protein
MNGEAIMLKGKIEYKLGEYKAAIASLEQAIKIQAEEESQGPP